MLAERHLDHKKIKLKPVLCSISLCGFQLWAVMEVPCGQVPNMTKLSTCCPLGLFRPTDCQYLLRHGVGSPASHLPKCVLHEMHSLAQFNRALSHLKASEVSRDNSTHLNLTRFYCVCFQYSPNKLLLLIQQFIFRWKYTSNAWQKVCPSWGSKERIYFLSQSIYFCSVLPISQVEISLAKLHPKLR